MTQPKEIYISEFCYFDENNISNKKCSSKRFWDSDIKYLSEEHFNSTIEKWKEEEKIWIKQLEEKDKEIEKLKEEVKWLLSKIIK